MKPTPKEPRAYHTPQVMDYGNVKQITMTGAKAGNADASTRKTKTHA
jgi:hypothetical protein